MEHIELKLNDEYTEKLHQLSQLSGKHYENLSCDLLKWAIDLTLMHHRAFFAR
ncbi:MAG: hypothetical protein ACXADY_27035 [Candidatus Hodarchaeales archaeon]|jgi:hypothetical protein